jgi:hypothetical protein
MNIVVRSNLVSEARSQRRRFATRQIVRVGLILLIAAACTYWSVTHGELTKVRQEYAAKRAADAKLNEDLDAARARAGQRKTEVTRRDAVLGYASSRTNLAPVLETLFAAVPANVEISALRILAPTMDGCTVQITGRTAGAQPRLECDKCRLLLTDSLAETGFTVTATFSKLEDVLGTVHFEEAEYPIADFVIEMKLKPVPHNDGKT